MLVGAAIFCSTAIAREVRVGIYENEPKIFTNAANEPDGIFVDLLEAIAEQHDWQLSYVKCEWTQCLNHLNDGSIDLMPDVAKSADRSAIMDFHQTPALKSWSEIYRRFDTQIDSITELENKRIAVLKGSIQEAEFNNVIRSFGVAVELVGANSHLQVFELVQSGQADAAIANHYFGDFHAAEYDLEETSILFQPTKLYFATAKGRNKDLLSTIDQQLSIWQTNKNSEYFLAIKKWNTFAKHEGLPRYVKEILLFITLLLLMTAMIALVLRARLRAQKLGLIAANNQLTATLDAMPDLLFEIDQHGRYLAYHSPRTELLAAPPEVLIGKTLHDALPFDVAEVCMAEIHKANESGSAKGGLIALDLPDGKHWFELSIAKKPVEDGKLSSFIVMSRDITQRKVAENKLARLTKLYAALSECNQAIVRCKTTEELFPIICHDAVQFGGMKMAWIGILDEHSQLVRPVASFGSGIEYLAGVEISTDASGPKGRGPTGTAVRENRPYWCQDFQHAPETSVWHERGAQFGWGASASLPILCKNKVVGAFTLYAGEVGSFDEAAQNLLVEMAMDISYALDRFEDEIKRMQMLNELHSSQDLVKMAGELARIGAWAIELPEMRVVWSDEVCIIHEMPIGIQPTLEQGINFYAPEYLDRIKEVVGKCISDGSPFDEELQIITATGKRIWVRAIGRAERGSDGEIYQVQGAFQDISELKEVEQRIHEKDVRYKLLFESLITGFALHEIILDEQGKPVDYRFLEINPAFETMTGLLVENVIGHSVLEVIPTLDRFWIERYGAVALTGKSIRFEYGVPEFGKHFEVLAYSPARGQFATLFTDVTERKKVEASLGLQARRAEALLTLPLESERMTEHDFMSYAVEIVEKLTESSISFIHLVHEDQITIELGSWSRATQEKYCHAVYDNHYPIDKAGIWADALRQRRPIVINDYASAMGKHGLPEGHAHLERLISVPVLDGGLVRMMVGVGNKAEYYTDLDVETTQLMANTIWHIVQQRRAEFALQQSEEIFSHFMTNSPIYVFFKDENIRSLRLSKNYEQMVGKPMSEMLGKNMDELFPSDFAKMMVEDDRRILTEGKTITVEEEFNGHSYSTIKFPISLNGRPTYLAGYTIDITEKKNKEENLRRLTQAVEQSPITIVITDLDANIEYANANFTKVTGYTLEEVLGKNPRILHSGRTPKATYDDMWAHLTAGIEWRGELINRTKDGVEYIEEALISPVRQGNGEITHFLAIKQNITDKRRDEERIQQLAHFDHLTGLPNRSLLNERFSYALSLAQRSGEPLAVMFLDLDHFKNINDTLGHSIGDRFLMEVATRLKETIRDEDTVSRLGGDEFILVFPGTDADAAAIVANKLIDAVSQPYQIDNHELIGTPSIGIAIYPNDGDNFEDLLKNADTAMYRVKQDSRNDFRFFTVEMQSHSERNLQLVNAMRHALARNEFHLQYQPQVNLSDGRIIGAEALLRWQHPELGAISPAEFIPIAEDSGQIIPIGEWVLRTAVKQMKDWLDSGLPPMVIAVNLSAVQFRQPNLSELVTRILEEAQLPAEYLELELTEAVAMDAPQAAITVMDKLFGCGIRMSIDDFGTGYSSLSYLKRFKVYKLKIDQSFVRDIGDDPEDKAIVTAIINLASSLGMHTIAEGVETASQLAFLRLQGCDEVQGYYFSKPLRATEFEAFVRKPR